MAKKGNKTVVVVNGNGGPKGPESYWIVFLIGLLIGSLL